jgi:hypothetical protein
MKGKRRKDERFVSRYFASRPVVLKRLQVVFVYALTHPTGVKNDFSFFASVLAIKVLSRLLVRVD